jgi:hypothetical protein
LGLDFGSDGCQLHGQGFEFVHVKALHQLSSSADAVKTNKAMYSALATSVHQMPDQRRGVRVDIGAVAIGLKAPAAFIGSRSFPAPGSKK